MFKSQIFYLYLYLMDPSIWGKHGWKFIHFVAQGYPNEPSQEQKLHYKNFLNSIKYILPCNLCRDHYTQNLINNPIDDTVLRNKNSFLDWTVKLHNIVNMQTGKEIIPHNKAVNLIVDDSCKLEKKNTENIIKENIKENDIDTNFIFILILVVLISIYFYYTIIKKN
jgi:hypothetical protein